MGIKAVFLDKDGTLVENVPYNIAPERVRLMPYAGEGLRLLQAAGYLVMVVSNQSGVARGLFPEAALGPVWHALAALLAREGVRLKDIYYCPHHPDGVVTRYARACTCRKPAPGLLLQAADEHGIALACSWMVGDILDDVEAGQRAGCRTVLLAPGGETEWRQGQYRTPHLRAADLREAAQLILQYAANSSRPAPLEALVL